MSTRRFKHPMVTLFVRFLLILPVFVFSRLCLYIFNLNLFQGLSFVGFLKVFAGGIRFDLSALFMVNILIILVAGIPLVWRNHVAYRRFVNVLFVVVNSIAFLPNYADSVYFRFTMKRMTGDFFNYMKAGGSDAVTLMPQYVKDFWPFFVLWVVSVFFLIFIVLKIKYEIKGKNNWKFYLQETALLIFGLGIAVISIRGGLQMKPIHILTGGQYAEQQYVPLVINSPFSIIKTWGQNEIHPVHFFNNENDLNAIYNPVQQSTDSQVFRKNKNCNVVIIILESFSTEHIGALKMGGDAKSHQGFTPFLDSLIGQSLVFEGFSNGKRSIEGIPAVVASLPTLMNNDYITSSFSGNRINSLASILNREGYETSFFHGGKNGTMNFDAFSKMAGFQHYYGRNEYANDQDFDGKWGIFDEPFFQFFANKLDKGKKPFLGVLFTLSSHHPYTVPEKYKGKFPKGNLDIEESIGYTDFALREFFQTVSKLPWFDETLFVITADHTSESELPVYQTRAGMYSVPVLFYRHQSDLRGKIHQVAQQTDIMPSVLTYLGYSEPFIAFGNSVFNGTAPRFAVNFLNGTYMLAKDHYVLLYGSDSVQGLYQYPDDVLMKNNLAVSQPAVRESMKTFLRAVIQQYNNRICGNRLTLR